MLWQQQRLHINYTLVWMRSLALMVHPAKALGSLADPDADADGGSDCSSRCGEPGPASLIWAHSSLGHN